MVSGSEKRTTIETASMTESEYYKFIEMQIELQLNGPRMTDDQHYSQWHSEKMSEWNFRNNHQEVVDGATVYVNETLFRTELSIQRIRNFYAMTFGCNVINITKTNAASFESYSISIYPAAEKLFQKRGYVAAGEKQKFGKGEQSDTLFLQRNKAAICLQFHIVKTLINLPDCEFRVKGKIVFPETLLGNFSDGVLVPLLKRNETFFPLVDLDLMSAMARETATIDFNSAIADAVKETKKISEEEKKPIAELTEPIKNRLYETLEKKYTSIFIHDTITILNSILNSQFTNRKLQKIISILIDTGAKKLLVLKILEAMTSECSENAVIQDACAMDSSKAKIIASMDNFTLISETEDEIEKQICWEAENSAKLFSGAEKNGLILWQTQILAYLRIVAWEIELQQHPEMNKNNNKAKEDIAFNSQVRSNNANEEHISAFKHVTFPPVSTLVKLRERAWGSQFEKLKFAKPHIDKLRDSELAAASLHASTFNDNFCLDEGNAYYSHSSHLRVFGRWIGDLKRNRNAVLTRRTADFFKLLFRPYPGKRNYHSSRDFGTDISYQWVFDRFGAAAWPSIFEACKFVSALTDKAFVEVVYNWTRNVDVPWAAKWHEDIKVLEITGPLLDFPISEADKWNAAAEELAKPKA